MRKTLRLLTLVVMLAAIASACSKKDDDKPSSVNTIQLNGASFKVEAASIMAMSVEDAGLGNIVLASGDGETNVSALSIVVESFTKETMPGTYSFPTAEGDKVLGDYITQYISYSNNSTTSSNLEEGTVTVIANGGNNYTVTVDLTMNDGARFTGSYTGEFETYFVVN